MRIAEAVSVTGGLSCPQKFRPIARAYGGKWCRLGKRLRRVKGSVCSVCYAQKGRAFFPGVQAARERRQKAMQKAGQSRRAGQQWAEAMAVVIGRGQYFRWFDSGDLPSPGFLDLIGEVVRRTPECAHWLSTREAAWARRWADTNWLSGLTIRVSAPLINERLQIDSWPAGLVTSGVYQGEPPLCAGWVCPATRPDCPPRRRICHAHGCRACWSIAPTVWYGLH